MASTKKKKKAKNKSKLNAYAIQHFDSGTKLLLIHAIFVLLALLNLNRQLINKQLCNGMSSLGSVLPRFFFIYFIFKIHYCQLTRWRFIYTNMQNEIICQICRFTVKLVCGKEWVKDDRNKIKIKTTTKKNKFIQ